jgi:GMP synthase-like glutamine amidotransferase
MGRWVVLQHVAFEGPGTIADVAREHGAEVDIIRLFDGATVPTVDQVDGLVVMGGPMGALSDAKHPYLADERALLADCVSQDVPVLGVCLGAQLLATALGAPLFRLGAAEIGVGHVRLTAEGLDDPVVGTPLREGLLPTVDRELVEVVHWHRDTFALPHGAVRLARTGSTPNQAFRVGRNAYGFQFHVEASEGWRAAAEPHWPADVPLRADDIARVERTGRPMLEAFFRVALGGR